jgi:hypothetical protein
VITGSDEGLEEVTMDFEGDATARRVFKAGPLTITKNVVEVAHPFAVAQCHVVTLLR